MSPTTDQLFRAASPDGGLLVRAAVTTALCDRARLAHGTSPTATAALGRALTAALLLGNLLKDGQTILLQWRGGGPLGPVIVEGRPDLAARGYVVRPTADVPSKNGKIDVGGGIGTAGELVVVKDLGLREPYVSRVPLQTGEVGDDLAYYLLQSEQIPAAVAVGVFVVPDYSVAAAGGVLVEALPGADPALVARVAENLQTMGSVTGVLLQGAGAEGLLDGALAGVPFSAGYLGEPAYRCSCQPDRLEAVLAALGAQEAEAILAEEGELRVRCVFCATHWRKGGLDRPWERDEDGVRTGPA